MLRLGCAVGSHARFTKKKRRNKADETRVTAWQRPSSWPSNATAPPSLLGCACSLGWAAHGDRRGRGGDGPLPT